MLNNKGMTLIEVMISLLLFLIVSLALLQTSVLTVDQNMRDTLRDEAVRVAETRMSEARALCFTTSCDDLDTSGKGIDNVSFTSQGYSCPSWFPAAGIAVTRNVGNVSSFLFCTTRTVDQPSDDVRQVTVEVGYMWRGTRYDHKISSLVRRS